jgi:hypothetical protein
MNKKQNKKQPFDYNAELLSLTKAKIFSKNIDLNKTIGFMQNEIDMYKEKNNDVNNKYSLSLKNNITISKRLKDSLIEQLSLLEDKLHLQKKITYQTKSNSRFIKQIMFLNNRNFFQRLFNVQYKENE